MFKISTVASALVSLSLARSKTPADNGYFRGLAYRAMQADIKLEQLWEQCQANQDFWAVPYESLDELFAQRMAVTTCSRNDEMKAGHVKSLHAEGVVGKVAWEDLGGHDYTGWFNGSSEAILRFSEGNFLTESATGLTPTFAMKFLRNGIESVNLFGSSGFEPSESWNFFANEFSNDIPLHTNELNKQTILNKFAETNRFVGRTGLGEFARFQNNGDEAPTPIDDYKLPFKLNYVPSEDVYDLFPEEQEEGVSFKDQLKTIPVDSVLFEVWAESQPEGWEGNVEQHIANIRLTTDLINSQFGDERLFFQHETNKWDFEKNPRWKKVVEKAPMSVPGPGSIDIPLPAFPDNRDDAEALVNADMLETGCPFAWLLN